MAEITAIIDYGAGNLKSAAKAFERAARDSAINAFIEVTSDAQRVRAADRIVLPGVGAFADCLAGLGAVPGMREVLEEKVRAGATPFFGICVGMQLMAVTGLEKGRHQGLGWIEGEVRRLSPADPYLKIPHMGWNTLRWTRKHPVTAGISDGPTGLHAYFVHSYQLVPDDPDDLAAIADYGGQVTAMIARDNMVGTQFHPEKSQALGLRLISNFLRWKP